MFSDSGREWKHFSFLSGLEWECFSFNNQTNIGEGSSGIYSVQYNCGQKSKQQEICCCCCSVTQSCPTLCIPMECSMLGFPVLHYLPRVCSNACPLSQWCYPTISSSVVPFSSCLQSFPASRSFLIGWLFASGGQSIGASASASVLLMNIQGWFPLGLTGLIPCSPRDPEESSPASQFKLTNSLALSFLSGPVLTSIHGYWKNHSFD